MVTTERAVMIAQKQILSFREAVLYLDVSESFLYKLTSKKAIAFAKPNGGKIYFKKEDLNNWMLQNKNTSTEEIQQYVFDHLKTNAR